MRIGISGVMASMSLAGLGACGGVMTTSDAGGARLASIGDVTEAQWVALGQRRIFFGHQSVGGNIMDGVADVMAGNPGIKLNVIESKDLKAGGRPAFFHAAIGRNDRPIEKFDDFVAVASRGFAQESGVAMVKLCYVDIHRNTDPEALFDDYRRRVAALRSQNPSLQIVHFTLPLTGIENWKGVVRAKLSGNATQRERNIVRARYNDLVRRAYEGNEPMFDIARLESTLPDGRRTVFKSGDEMVPVLAPEYTDDGGHLNAVARRRVAEQFLIMLARLEPASPQPVTAQRGT